MQQFFFSALVIIPLITERTIGRDVAQYILLFTNTQCNFNCLWKTLLVFEMLLFENMI